MSGSSFPPSEANSTANPAQAVFVTAPSREEAKRIARALVERRLAACVQLAPIESLYLWEDAIQEEEEILLIVKTRAALFPEIEAFIREIHSYEAPQIVALPIVEGSTPYLDWLRESTSPPPSADEAAQD